MKKTSGFIVRLVFLLTAGVFCAACGKEEPMEVLPARDADSVGEMYTDADSGKNKGVDGDLYAAKEAGGSDADGGKSAADSPEDLKDTEGAGDGKGADGEDGPVSSSGVKDTDEGAADDGSGEYIEASDSGAYDASKICVYVTGQVRRPGVYYLNRDARMYEAIDLAGGLTAKASADGVNMAEKLTDGQQIDVLSKAEYKKAQKAAKSGADGPAGADAGSGGSSDGGQTQSAVVNINTAGTQELMTLPGIGESKAAAIISYREENGGFQTIEDIMKVPGIKEASFAQIQSMITV